MLLKNKEPLQESCFMDNIKKVNSEYTIVLSDGDLLSRVCGTNDSNLKLIEKHIGVPVFTRGNEISISEEDPRVLQNSAFKWKCIFPFLLCL